MADFVEITKAQGRRFVLQHLHLLPPRKLRGKPGVMEYLRHVNCVQYDPINVVGQNPHLVLQSRVANYRPKLLDELLYNDRQLLDGFDKQMSIYPAEDWPQFDYYREQLAQRYLEADATSEAVELIERVRQEIEERGPLSSTDIEEDTRMDWWLAGTVRAVRIALDILFYRGDIVVHHRVGTRRYFDLAERVLPAELMNVTERHASQDEYLDWHVYRRFAGPGLLQDKQSAAFGGCLGWRGGKLREAMRRLAAAGKLTAVRVAGVPRKPFYVRTRDLPALEAAAKPLRRKARAAFIAPLDHLMWDGGIREILFDFSYSWEVYVPENKRKYGYYVLPVLYGERFVARMDPGMDRANGVLTIKGWWWEQGVDFADEVMLAAISEALTAFCRYLGAKQIKLGDAVKGDQSLVQAVRAAVLH
jgi:uncharacterized protein YcaQ